MSAPQIQTTSERDDTGRFTPGNPGGPGNTNARRVAQLRRLLLSKISDEDAGALMDKLLELAKEGNLHAIKLVLQYTIGKPGPIHLLDDSYRDTSAPPPSERREPLVPPTKQGTHVPRSPAPADLMRQIEDAIKMSPSLSNLGQTPLPIAANGRR